MQNKVTNNNKQKQKAKKGISLAHTTVRGYYGIIAGSVVDPDSDPHWIRRHSEPLWIRIQIDTYDKIEAKGVVTSKTEIQIYNSETRLTKKLHFVFIDFKRSFLQNYF